MQREIKFFDPSIIRKKELTDQNYQENKDKNIVLPSEVEISESGLCNRKCSFCPRSDPNYNHVNEFISEDLHSKLCNQLGELKYKGVIRYSGFVEPLLDKNIYNLINKAKKTLPNAKVEIVTNGDVLNKARLKKLFDNGLDTILISVYDSEEDAIKFEKLCKEIPLENKQYVIRKRYLPPEQDFGITLSNRAGMMENAEYKINTLNKALNEPCYYPSYTFFMDYNGDVLMCPHDWGKKIILGNMKKENFLDIWASKKAINLRKKLNKADRNFSPCKSGDVKGSLIGEKHSNFWNKA
jgi:radical SAM protein with 4Fe4S-binding SPASM domain